MDAERIDVLARSVAIGMNRRRLIAGLVAGLVQPLLGDPRWAAAGGCGKVGKRCDNNGDCCAHAECRGGECKCRSGWKDCGNGTCVNRDTDEDNCGACGTVCAAGEACCAGTCADLQADAANCGECDNACGDTEACIGGACVVTRPVDGCSPICLGTCCDGNCVDLVQDPANCGACGHVCPSSDGRPLVCESGRCVLCRSRVICGRVCCATGKSCCDGACLDLDDDPTNCGACGRACGDTEVCRNGLCTDCPGDVYSCDNVCCNRFEGCSGGRCVPFQK
jgi:hypothetical protein